MKLTNPFTFFNETLSLQAHEAAFFAKWDPNEYRDLTPFGWWLDAVFVRIKHTLRIWTCDLLDHDLEDDSSFGTDSGTECLSCTRCGWSWSHTYY